MEGRVDIVERDPLTHVLTGVQAIPRLLVAQRARDHAEGRHTAAFVSGYPGSPLAGLDTTIQRFPGLAEHDIHFAAGLNEELAATAVWGSQLELPGRPLQRDGVVGMWFAKSPGLDRAADAIRHANTMGGHPRGGVLALVGDDPGCASSTLPSSSERTLAALSMPVFSPRSSADIVRLGQHGVALSRLTGLWVGLKIVAGVAEGIGVVEPADLSPPIVVPEVEWNGAPWAYEQRRIAMGAMALAAEDDLFGPRWHALEQYLEVNPINRVHGCQHGAWLGIVAGGHTYDAVVQALSDLGVRAADLTRHGIRLLELAALHPLSRSGLRAFAADLDTVLVVEEKAAFLEPHIAALLYGAHTGEIVGERDRAGRPLIPRGGALTAARLVEPLRRVLQGRIELAPTRSRIAVAVEVSGAERGPYFCSGCPHNRSTVVPDGALVGLGIGCHAMAITVPDRQEMVTGITQMGGEGAHWIGQAPFNETSHVFQNLGDGTLAHSGQLAIQACIAAGVNITFKILFNGGIAMTGAQAVQGGLSVPELTRKLAAEGVARIVVCADDVDRYRRVRRRLADGVTVCSRDRLDEAQRELQGTPGVTVLIYDQLCAAESRRLRRRGTLPARTTRVVINEEVCEGCGDCGAKSNCLSVEPVMTELGRKTRIDQTSCNTDYSCLDGDCPSFVTLEVVEGPAPRPRDLPGEPPEPERPAVAAPFNLVLVGVGGTGIVTVNRVLAVAGDLDGFVVSGVDQLGSSQKAGAVTSHLRLAPSGWAESGSNRVSVGAADTLLGFDVLVAASPAVLEVAAPDRSHATVSTSVVPTGQMVFDADRTFPDVASLRTRIDAATASARYLDAASASTALFGTREQANVLLLGAAYQSGAIPISAVAIERALELNGVAVDTNVAAFKWGRVAAHDPAAFSAAVDGPTSSAERPFDIAALLDGLSVEGPSLELAADRARRLVEYQSVKTARAYLATVNGVWRAERAVTERTDFTDAVARGLFHVTAYKDEYEVARLLIDERFRAQLERQHPNATRIRYQLHPPVLRALGLRRKIGVSAHWRPALRAMAAGKALRGTWADPFGRTAVRRLERRLLDEYGAMVRTLTADLGTDNYERSVEAAAAVLSVRGYEHLKIDAYQRYHERLETIIDS